MARFVKYFVLGMSKTLDIGNRLEIHRHTHKTTDNIQDSWKNIGLLIKENMHKQHDAKLNNARQ